MEDLEQDQLNDMLKGAEPAPIHLPPGAAKTVEGKFTIASITLIKLADPLFVAQNPAEVDEDAMLKQLQAELAM